MLEEDTKHFLNFFNKIKADTQAATDDLDNVKKLKTEKQQRLKQLEEEIHMLHSATSKSIESLEICNSYKNFLEKLASKYKMHL